MQDLYIAIIDDDEDDVTLLQECFEKYNFITVKGFSSGQEFLDNVVKASLPCLIVIDLNLHDIRAVDLIDQIKANSQLAEVPIIVYTTAYTPKEQISCEELQIRLLKKPNTILEWDNIALMMVKHCDQSL